MRSYAIDKISNPNYYIAILYNCLSFAIDTLSYGGITIYSPSGNDLSASLIPNSFSMMPRHALWEVFMQRSISKTPTSKDEGPVQMRPSSIIKKVSVAYGTCCSLATCAILLLMVGGRQSPLGFNISLLFLAVFWSGVPLLLLAMCSLRGRSMTRIVFGAALLLSFAPAAVCFFYPLVKICFFDGNSSFGIASSITLLFSPVVISLILLSLLISQYFAEKRPPDNSNRNSN